LPYYPDDFIQEVISRNDIVEVISAYVALKRKGRNYWGLCPFHGEKTPSFSVKADQQFYYCFGCHAGGNVIGFIQSIERLDFSESVKLLAERVRLPLPELMGGGNQKDKGAIKQKMQEAMRDAAVFYHAMLNSPAGRSGYEYLKSRGISDSIIKRFGLGYSGTEWNSLTEHMMQLGYEGDLLTEAGLSGKNEKGFYDKFRNRVMFPIIDYRGRVIAFGGRVLDDSKPKYLNSPDTPVFNKRYNLYGIHCMRQIKDIPDIVLVEGYMDVIGMHKAGFPRAVASLGTALTEEQARLLKRFTANVYICYDGDEAGRNAALRGMDILSGEGLKVRVVSLPDGMDPDDYAGKRGLAGIQDALQAAVPLNDYKIRLIEEKYDLSDEEQRKDYVTECCRQVLAGITAPVELSMYIKRLHMQTGFPELAIEAETQRAASAKQPMNRQVNNRNTISNDNIAEKLGNTGRNCLRAEKMAVMLALGSPQCRQTMLSALKPDDFSEEDAQNVVREVARMQASQGNVSAAALMAVLDEGSSRWLAESLNSFEAVEGNQAEAMRDCISAIKNSLADKRIDELQVLLRNPLLARDERLKYLQEINQLNSGRKTGDLE